MTFAPTVPLEFRSAWWEGCDVRLRRTLGASSVTAVVLLVVIYLTPPQPEIVSVQQVPQSFARLILEPPKPLAPEPRVPAAPAAPSARGPAAAPALPDLDPAPAAPAPTAPSAPSVGGRRAETQAPSRADAGLEGRQRAQREVASQVAATTASLKTTLAGLSTSLHAPSAAPSANAADASTAGRSLRKGARAASEVAGGSGAKADLAGSSVAGSTVAIAQVLDVRSSGSGGGGASESARAGGRRPGSAGSTSLAGGDGSNSRSHSSLLAVVRRYAAGIQLCYDGELQKSPGLRGKLAITLTVTPLGEVSAAKITEDTLSSSRVNECVLSQVRGWRFPAAPGGDTTFTVPFVFTPPSVGG